MPSLDILFDGDLPARNELREQITIGELKSLSRGITVSHAPNYDYPDLPNLISNYKE